MGNFITKILKGIFREITDFLGYSLNFFKELFSAILRLIIILVIAFMGFVVAILSLPYTSDYGWLGLWPFALYCTAVIFVVFYIRHRSEK
ncbi:MAG: hypothetical protein WC788_08475 [Candidatus Paceibacterota bacterium]|jgi:ABC-type proline/glycine betaine transport system permease subunit